MVSADESNRSHFHSSHVAKNGRDTRSRTSRLSFSRPPGNREIQRPGARHDLAALRKFLSEDDGEPFYTVNLYSFHAEADYPADSAFGGTGIEAYDRFSRVMISLMTKRVPTQSTVVIGIALSSSAIVAGAI